ncbi:hypothetical protein PV05_08509 [Exophiala xenobiotica]|uniref:HIG1 domain-containing protein n=1 Tax=Exophiala xenobiotica TaxID=348802 RepID=A0A0D2CS87_9EURO|nr:uncharacterized protein PV05_08509 [Exophiala xenobiotica]KIW52897.1 hypothetical protein PV05_08509 [Exophiala xenobiotica]
MKILDKDEEQEYYSAIRKNGAAAGVAGFLVGLVATAGLHRYYAPFKHLSPAVRGTFVVYPTIMGISYGSTYGSHSFQSRIHPETKDYIEQREDLFERMHAGAQKTDLSREWLYEHKMQVLGATWGVSMITSLQMMARDPFQTGARKLVQARVLAQATTLTALLALALIETYDMREGKGKYQKVLVVDTSNPEHRKHLDKKLGSELHPTPVTLKDILARTEEQREDEQK